MQLDRLLKATQKALTKESVSYLKGRGIKKSTALEWELGYMPSEEIILNLGEDLDCFLKTGILIKNIHKTPLKQYLTFPMYNQYNELIGMSGRPLLPNDEVKKRGLKKYWHSIFDKKNFLFGLNKAISSARELGYIIVTEGQFDTIIPSQEGVKNIVATCGTALTENQAILLSRYVEKAYIMFDSDEAGRKAFQRLKEKKHPGIELMPIFLPEGEDPDSYIRKYGKDQFLELINE